MNELSSRISDPTLITLLGVMSPLINGCSRRYLVLLDRKESLHGSANFGCGASRGENRSITTCSII